MSFNRKDCIIRKLYCGNGSIPRDTNDKMYSRKGTSYECLRKGIGLGKWQHRKKSLDKNSLQQITYVGEVFEENFKKLKICSIPTLIAKMSTLSNTEKEKIIHKGCTKSNGTIDHRAVNAIILFLNDQGVGQLPQCKIIKE